MTFGESCSDCRVDLLFWDRAGLLESDGTVQLLAPEAGLIQRIGISLSVKCQHSLLFCSGEHWGISECFPWSSNSLYWLSITPASTELTFHLYSVSLNRYSIFRVKKINLWGLWINEALGYFCDVAEGRSLLSCSFSSLHLFFPMC